MKLCGGFLMPLREICSRMQICVSIWTLPQMTSHLCLLILSSFAVSSELGLEDVFFSPQVQTVREGEGVFFQCVSGESSPPARITWLKDGTLVTKGRHIQGEYGGGNQKKTSGTLHLFNVTLEDEGLYICVTHNPLLNISKKSKPAQLTVQGVPRRLQFIHGPDSITVVMGTEVSMHCAVRGFPVPMVHWFKDGCLLSNCSSSFSLQNNGQLLTFSNVTREHEGSYHCEVSNHKETIKSQPAFLLTADMEWSFVQQPVNQTVKRGENVTVTCRPPYSRPAAQVAWFKNSQLLSPKGHQTMLPSGDLFFYSVQEDDSGSYFCRASNIHLQRFLTSRRATLSVLAPPSVKLHPQVLTVPVGARVVLECEVSGHPPPSISWVKRGHSKQTGGKIVFGLRNATLYINSARSYDEGAYVCEASNTLGHSSNTAMLKVAVSPIIVTFVDRVSCRIGGAVDLPCMAVGLQPIKYSWTQGRAETYSAISPTEDRLIDEDGTLHISNVQYSDVGEYFCTAENRAGRHQRRSILAVTAEHRPADRGKQTRLVLSASTKTSKDLPVSQSSDSMAEQHLGTTHNPHVQAQQHEASCSLPHCDATTNRAPTSPPLLKGAVAELKMPSRSLGWFLQHNPNHPTTSPTQSLVTQMQPPMLLPPPHPNFQSVNMSDQVQLNTSQQGDPVQSTKSGNNSELTEWLKRNTSQSPMTSNDPRVTQQSPSWLPVLEKHDIPIVVGVGVSLAFIFITVTFYAVVQKNEAAPTVRAAQRNLGIPIRHTECRAEGRSYENRAFEDDDCVTVIEQSPNTSDTRALPPGLSLVTVKMEPTFEDLQEDTQPALDDYSVTVETYPEPILDTKIDPSLEEEKRSSLSQPSIQLQCAEDWTSSRGDNRCSPCHNVLPPPSSLPSHSPSPSPPSRHQEGLRSSLTLQSAEAGGAPIHHSLSISHGNHPLLLSHQVSLGLTTVAVDVHFYPAATASVAVGTSTHINSVSNSTSVAAPPLFTSPFVSSQENDQTAARIQQFK
ncbi:Hemicentin-1 [Dissostichus eleginoides]|uniref:Hemicentin-1 n=1 Tax=Dissostichus eleginoides TaxID=100907 RepID=A0AAD9C213_DISEL|nr:Hemicentin-1 [Dissostichus eleginoides]